jgi:hypothetical protein
MPSSSSSGEPVLAGIDALLRGEGRHAPGGGRLPWRELVLAAAASGFLYGAVMGSYGGRVLQSLYSASKVPLLLGVSSLLCLPSFFVVNCLLGLRADFAAACRGLLSAQAALAVCLAALAPAIVVAYLSIERYQQTTLANGLAFAVATLGGQLALSRHYAPLIRANPRHRLARRLWLLLYVFVAIQMAWVLRPFIGAPGLPTRFFREDAWSNAYVELVKAMRAAFRFE